MRAHRPLPLAILGLLTALTLGWPALLPGRAQTAEPPDAAGLERACRRGTPYVAQAVLGSWLPGEAGGPDEDPGRRAGLILQPSVAGAAPAVLATRGQLGDVYGVAYAHGAGQLYVAAYHRAGGRFGPGGPGAIYRVDLAGGQVAELARLDAGPDRHPPLGDGQAASGVEPGVAAEDAAWVGRTGLGDLDIAADESELYVTNLSAGTISRIALPGGKVLDSRPHGASRERWFRNARLFGLGVHDGHVYHGVVDSRAEDGVQGILEARVYRALPGGAEVEPVLRVGIAADASYPRNVGWGPWTEDPAAARPDQPMAADIAFTAAGQLVLGLRDRNVDRDPGCTWDGACAGGASLGDLLPTRPREGGGLEAIRGPAWFRDTDSALNDMSFGSLLPVAGADWLIAPGRPSDAGARGIAQHVYDVSSGNRFRSSAPWAGDGPGGDDRLAAGDAALLCDPAAEIDPDVVPSLTAEAEMTATAAVGATMEARATVVVATRTAHAPTQVSRRTAAVATATALAPTLEAEEPTRVAARRIALATSSVSAPKVMTLVAVTARAIHTKAALATAQPPATATAYAFAHSRIKNSCRGGNPYMVTAQMVPMRDGVGNVYDADWLRGQASLIAFNDTAADDLSQHFRLGFQDQVGAVYGIAQDLSRDVIYAGAYNKRLAAYGPLGPGGIYQLDIARGRVLPWAAVPAGADNHLMDQNFDSRAAAGVGTVGLGDLELTTAGDQLFAVNLLDGQIYRFSVPDARLLDVIPHGATGLPWGGSARPFGLAWRDGWLFHGLVDSHLRAESNGRPLEAYVYRSRPDGSEMTEVSRIDLDYGRAPAWSAWERGANDIATADQPMLVDIEFREDGDLVLGLRDRKADSAVMIAASGDMVLTMAVGGRYIPMTVPEFYQDNLLHGESAWGSLASLPWLDQVVATVIDPIQIYSGGLAWYDNVSGYDVARETIYAGANMTFGKAAGLGDIESLCAPLTPTPTRPAQTATRTPTATSTPSATATASATATRTATVTPTATTGHYAIYLPFTERLLCRPEGIFTDAVLVLDMSTSMFRATRTGRSKHEAALEAARLFIAQMKLEPAAHGGHDRVALVGFNDAAWIEVGLTRDRAAVGRALDHLPAGIQQGTRIDLALERGRDAFLGAPRQGNNQPVMILLTDGLPNRVPFGPGSAHPECPNQECTVLTAATTAKADGVRVFAIGLGETDDVLDRLLGDVASARGDYYFAPDGEDLAGIYRGIAGRLTACPD